MLDGKGTYGIVYSNPILPFIKKIVFSVSELNKLDEIDNDLCVCKVFIDIQNFIDESNSYMYLFDNFYIDPQFFNMPIFYGEIDQAYIQHHPEIYNSVWSGDDLSYILSQFQITFVKGIPVDKIIISNTDNNILDKFKNIFSAVKFLNDNSLLYDDLKIDNIICVNDLFKISDFSSLIHVKDLNYEYYTDSKLSAIFYFIYNPLLNKILYLFLCLEIKKNRTYLDLDNELHNEIKTHDAKIYVNYCQKKFSEVIKITKELILTIKVGAYSLEDNFEKIVYIDIDIKDIFVFFDNKTLVRRNYKYITALYKYYKLKHRLITDIKKDIIKRINIYSLGMILFSLYLIQPVQKILELAIKCSLNAFIINDIVYITDPNIDEIIENM